MEKGKSVCVVGLGYVGMPLFNLIAARLERSISKLIGVDKDPRKIEVAQRHWAEAEFIEFTVQLSGDFVADYFVICLPTPVDDNMEPELSGLEEVLFEIGRKITPGSVIILESTVYPKFTEDKAVDFLKQGWSSMTSDPLPEYHLGFSSERINPGDQYNTLETVVKVTSGLTEKAGRLVDDFYCSLGLTTYLTKEIAAAELSKCMENIQRDVNIALMNEFYLFCKNSGIDFDDALNAASTKWNFVGYSPGLVGGHCVAVDPYYYLSKAIQVGAKPLVSSAAREINEQMIDEVVTECLKCVYVHHGSTMVFLGATFKPNVSDIRNSKVLEVVKRLSRIGKKVWIYDPLIEEQDTHEVASQFDCALLRDCADLRGPYIGFISQRHEIFSSDEGYKKLVDNAIFVRPLL